MPASHHRLSILPASEIEDLYGLPRFASADRDFFFQLSGPELAAVAAIRTLSVAAHLILQLGYFKAKRQFWGPLVFGAISDGSQTQHWRGAIAIAISMLAVFSPTQFW